jgi:hypothetical protein
MCICLFDWVQTIIRFHCYLCSLLRDESLRQLTTIMSIAFHMLLLICHIWIEVEQTESSLIVKLVKSKLNKDETIDSIMSDIYFTFFPRRVYYAFDSCILFILSSSVITMKYRLYVWHLWFDYRTDALPSHSRPCSCCILDIFVQQSRVRARLRYWTGLCE